MKIGVAVPDFSTFVAINPAFGVGDQRQQVEAVVEAARREGTYPLDDVELVFRSFDSVSTEEKRAAADGFARDDVVAVVGARDFTYGAVRLAETHRVPVVDVNAVPSSLHRRCAPYLFTLRAAQDVLYRSFVRWAVREGLLDGAVGVFSDRFTRESAAAAKEELEALGCDVRLHVDSDGAGVGSDQDESAAARFHDVGVDIVLPFVSGSSLIELLKASEERGYRPRVVDLETGEHTTEVTAALMPPAIYDGTPALTMNRVGEGRVGEGDGGRGFAAEAEAALRDHEAHTGRRLTPSDPATSGELSNVLIVRDLVTMVLEGLRRAGPAVTRDSFVAALESIEAMPIASGGDVTFTADEHWAIHQARAIRWDASASRWRVESEFEALPIG